MNDSGRGFHHIPNSTRNHTDALSPQMLLENVLICGNGSHIRLQIANHWNLMEDLECGQTGMLVGHTMNHRTHTHQSMGVPQVQGPSGSVFFMVLKGQSTISDYVVPQPRLLNPFMTLCEPWIERSWRHYALQCHTKQSQQDIAGPRKE